MFTSLQEEDLDAMAAAVQDGGVACLPTDTVYGIACLADHAGAIEKLYELKGRDRGKPLAAVFASVDAIEAMLPEMPSSVRAAIGALLPGPVTVIVAAAGETAIRLSGELGSPGTLGIRVIPSPLERLYRRLPSPLALTSANISGQPDPCELDEVDSGVLAACDFAVDAGRCRLARPSTVIDLRPLADDEPAAILRSGAVPDEEVRRMLTGVEQGR